MRFAVDAHAIGRHLTGNEVYVRSLLQAFAGLDRESEFLAYISVKGAELCIPEPFLVRPIAKNPFIRLGFDFAHRLRADRADLLHVQYTAPLRCPTPVVVSIHDVSFLEHPEYFPAWRRWQLQWSVQRTVRSAARIITGSEFSRDSIMRAYGLERHRIVVVPHAANPMFRPVNHSVASQRVGADFGFQGPYVLSVGDLQPRKNHVGLIEAFAKLVHAHPQLKHRLVLAGKETWFSERIRDAVTSSGIADRITFTGFVSDDDLLRLYNGCDCFVFPSFYEGFGIPVLEAMACGRAVACSNTSAMPEVADGAGILFDPYQPGEISRAMADILLDSELRSRLERLGLQRAAHFTWQKTAEMTLGVYYEVAGWSNDASEKPVGIPMQSR